ncbi:MAG: calcium/sodium antiporter, partial [Succinivibrionaceae bacterium]|nr:calcium/sodium antiporter [Succinivibrionaceae bacterium]
MFLATVAIIAGLAVLVYSADRFVLGASGTARCLGMSPFFIGMVIVGFGTSAPEMIVSAVSAYQGNPGIAIGNAYGSNIANIALILGVTALIIPIKVKASVIFRELPLLIAVTLLSAVLLWDLEI